jgi:hypothetical protein
MDFRMDSIRKFMLQEEGDDDELFLVLLPMQLLFYATY